MRGVLVQVLAARIPGEPAQGRTLPEVQLSVAVWLLESGEGSLVGCAWVHTLPPHPTSAQGCHRQPQCSQASCSHGRTAALRCCGG
eukprot:648137-Pelagomonas_calceolata.AAC.1